MIDRMPGRVTGRMNHAATYDNVTAHCIYTAIQINMYVVSNWNT